MERVIRYKKVTKIFGTGPDEVTALDQVTFDMHKGELVVFLGPSGCGKTTLLRLTNRLIPLTQGRITVNGRDISLVNGVKLRQSMGYAIQAIGLFPNKTIHGNIATVPRLLGWDEEKIEARVDELLRMLQLDPDSFRNRYPAELSGGQQQRIGVARCLAGDPEILLMDEPFGAIDPINREEIQNEFLKVQATLKKTIAFVTHDIHEAIKMGDKIAIFKEGKLIQYDTPEMILTQPKNSYIADFVGTDRALKVLGLMQAKDAMNRSPDNLLQASTGAREALKTLKDKGFKSGIVIDGDKPIGYVTAESLSHERGKIKETIQPLYRTLAAHETLKDTMSHMLISESRLLCVVNKSGRLEGTISFSDIQRAIIHIYAQNEKEVS